MRSSLPDAVTIAALRQLLARSYAALEGVQASTGQTLSELVDPSCYGGDDAPEDLGDLLFDLQTVIEAPGIPDPSGRTEATQLGQLEPGDEFYPLVERYKLPTWRGRVEAHLDDGMTRYTLHGHRSEMCALRSSFLVRRIRVDID